MGIFSSISQLSFIRGPDGDGRLRHPKPFADRSFSTMEGKTVFLMCLTRRAAHGGEERNMLLLESESPRKIPVARHGIGVGRTVRNHEWSRSAHTQAAAPVPVTVQVHVSGRGTVPSLQMRFPTSSSMRRRVFSQISWDWQSSRQEITPSIGVSSGPRAHATCPVNEQGINTLSVDVLDPDPPHCP